MYNFFCISILKEKLFRQIHVIDILLIYRLITHFPIPNIIRSLPIIMNNHFITILSFIKRFCKIYENIDIKRILQRFKNYCC